jgi:hypothetical protein
MEREIRLLGRTVWARRLAEVGVWSLGYAASPTKCTGWFSKGDRYAGYSMRQSW